MLNDNPFKKLLAALAKGQIRFVVAGGFAAVIHGVPRVTFDLDISVDFERKNIKKLLSVLREAGLRPRAPIPDDILLDKSAMAKMVREKKAMVFTFVHPDDALMQLDIFLTSDFSYRKLVTNSVIREFGGHKIRIASAKALLKMKARIRPLREKDLFDINFLQKSVGALREKKTTTQKESLRSSPM